MAPYVEGSARRFAAFACVVLRIAVKFADACFTPLAPFLVGSSTLVGVLLSACGVARCLALVVVGIAVHRGASSAAVLNAGLRLLLGSCVVTAVSVGGAGLLLGRLGLGVASACLTVAAATLVEEHIEPARQFTMLHRAFAVGSLGILAGPPFAGFAFEFYSWLELQVRQGLAFFPAVVLLAIGWLVLIFGVTLPDEDAENAQRLLSPASARLKWMHKHFGRYNSAIGFTAWAVAIEVAVLAGASIAVLAAGVVLLQDQGVPPQLMGLVPVPAGAVCLLTRQLAGGCFSGADAPGLAAVLTYLPLFLLSLAFVPTQLAAEDGPVPQDVVVKAVAAAAALSAFAAGLASCAGRRLLASLACESDGLTGYVVTFELASSAGMAVGPYLGIAVAEATDLSTLLYGLAAAGALLTAFAAVALRKFGPAASGGGSPSSS